MMTASPAAGGQLVDSTRTTTGRIECRRRQQQQQESYDYDDEKHELHKSQQRRCMDRHDDVDVEQQQEQEHWPLDEEGDDEQQQQDDTNTSISESLAMSPTLLVGDEECPFRAPPLPGHAPAASSSSNGSSPCSGSGFTRMGLHESRFSDYTVPTSNRTTGANLQYEYDEPPADLNHPHLLTTTPKRQEQRQHDSSSTPVTSHVTTPASTLPPRRTIFGRRVKGKYYGSQPSPHGSSAGKGTSAMCMPIEWPVHHPLHHRNKAADAMHSDDHYKYDKVQQNEREGEGERDHVAVMMTNGHHDNYLNSYHGTKNHGAFPLPPRVVLHHDGTPLQNHHHHHHGKELLLEHLEESPVPVLDLQNAEAVQTSSLTIESTLHSELDDAPRIQQEQLDGAQAEDDVEDDMNEIGPLTPLPRKSPIVREPRHASSTSSLSSETRRHSNPHHHHHHHHHHHKRRLQRPHETIHAQSLLLGLAFCAIWSTNNMMAPNLTEMAVAFGFDEQERDLYLGSYCALATGVFSFPIGAGIGICADFTSRQVLFCLTAAVCALSSLATAYSTRYWQLFLARWLAGGCMGGSVPVAFSFLGDLFSTEERNAASSGLTAMMGLGIIMGQVYAGMVGNGDVIENGASPAENGKKGWSYPFLVSSAITFSLSVLCFCLVKEPVRGGKERVLQKLIKSGTRYDRKLTWKTFWHAMRHNPSNMVLLAQGFFSSLPWGIIFVFLNDYLSQERGFSVPDATYIVLVFGLGCAAGGVLGGYWGQILQGWNRSYLPLFMSATTAAGVLPFLGLLDLHIRQAHGIFATFFSLSGGLIASLPSVNVRPCLINVNPPETRGASLTAANLLIQLGRGIGPSCITLLTSMVPDMTRQGAFNITLVLFWAISATQLLFLARTLPKDQDAMEEELETYAEQCMRARRQQQQGQVGVGTPDAQTDSSFLLVPSPPRMTDTSFATTNTMTGTSTTATSMSTPQQQHLLHQDDAMSVSLVSIEERMTSFDQQAARQTILYVSEGIKELRQEALLLPCQCGGVLSSQSSSSCDASSRRSDEDGEDDDDEDVVVDHDERQQQKNLWLRQPQTQQDELPLFMEDDYDSHGNTVACPPLDKMMVHDATREPTETTPLVAG